MLAIGLVNPYFRAMPNRLAQETSPYLLQHQNNPVDWFPWGEEALTRAREENKPILLSVGYSACHWCHVMEHESFENVETTKLMNANFVCIKVDREERPDLDHIYQKVTQIMTRSGGWPLTVFLTPELKPFFGGTYFPPEDRYGRPGFPRLLRALANAFQNERDKVEENAATLLSLFPKVDEEDAPPKALDNQPWRPRLSAIANRALGAFDGEHGGYAGAPKFPNPMTWTFLWRLSQVTGERGPREAALFSLDAMARGGIFDHLGGGFHRYSVDERWAVPHFEKMLYDNALLLQLYSEVLTAAGEPLSAELRERFLRVVTLTVDYLLREMRGADGMFYAAQDADSEGEEGKFFAWDRNDLAQALSPEDAALFARTYGVSEAGNFEHGKTVLAAQKVAFTAEERSRLRAAERALLAVRARRVAPGTDDKALVSWNGLLLSGLVAASFALREAGDEARADSAERAAIQSFASTLARAKASDGRLFSTVQKGRGKHAGYLDDYAFLLTGACDLLKVRALDAKTRAHVAAEAPKWIQTLLDHFVSADGRGFYFVADDHEKLVERPKNLSDQAIPSGTSRALQALELAIPLGLIEGELASRVAQVLERQWSALAPGLFANPFGSFEMLSAFMLREIGPVTIEDSRGSLPARSPFVFVATAPIPGKAGRIKWCHRQACHEADSEAEILRALLG